MNEKGFMFSQNSSKEEGTRVRTGNVDFYLRFDERRLTLVKTLRSTWRIIGNSLGSK